MSDHLDISSEPSTSAGTSAGRQQRRYLGTMFACCGVYTRVYVNRQETAYEGKCPKCSKRVQLRIGSGGTDSQFFTAY